MTDEKLPDDDKEDQPRHGSRVLLWVAIAFVVIVVVFLAT